MKKQTWEWEYLRAVPPTREVPPREEKPKPTGLRRWFQPRIDGEAMWDALEDHFASLPTRADIEAWLNELGGDRWELVLKDGDIYQFKRRKVIDLNTGIAIP